MQLLFVFLFLVNMFFPSNTFAKEIITWEKVGSETISIGDWTPPVTKIYVKDKEIDETITNGDFSKQQEGWSFGDNEVGIDKENTYALLKSHNSPLTQQFKNSHGFLMFSYTSFTQENLIGFDVPAFVVSIQDKEVYSITAEEIKETNPNEWIQVIVPLSSFEEEYLTISFSSGNTGDNEKPSWTYVDNVTTNVLAIETENDIRIVSEKDSKQYFKDLSSDQIFSKENLFIRDGFSTLLYWSEDKNQNKENEQTVQIYRQNKDDAVYLTDISLKKERNGEVRLKFQTHSSNRSIIVSYQFAFTNKEYLKNGEWKHIPKVNPLNTSSLHQIGKIEDLFFPSSDSKYLSIGCIDIFGNIQEIFVIKIGEYDE